MSPLEASKEFMAALEENDADRAGVVCSNDVVIELPGGETQMDGKEAARRLIRMAPPFVRIIREEEEHGGTVILRGLTRMPGQFANYTTWTFETSDGLITRVRFEWKPAN